MIKEEVISIFFFNIWCFFKNFANVLVEVQFVGYKFGLKGSTHTRENTVHEVQGILVEENGW